MDYDTARTVFSLSMNSAYTGSLDGIHQVGTALYKNEATGRYADVQVIGSASGAVALITVTAGGKTILEDELAIAVYREELAKDGFELRAQTDSLA